MKICFATNNAHKLAEVKAIIGNQVQLVSLKEIGCQEELPETHDTIPGNAWEKARYVWTHYHVPCFADDSGLEVVALNGAPGVYSAMYAGDQRDAGDNMELLLNNLQPHANRKAQFRTVIALCLPEKEQAFEGILPGVILTSRKGQGGFGYDPIFLPDGFQKTLAEMTMEEKNEISHRSVAVKKLAAFIRGL